MNDDSATRAIEAERLQIGHEVHDALLPLIVAAKMSLEAYADDHPDDRRLTQAITWLSDAMNTGRDLLSQVYPPELSSMNWTQAAKSFAERLGVAEVNWQLSDACYNYPVPVATAAYRIVSEAVRNAARHGKATQISVIATATEIVIEDNGSGFDPQQVPNDRYGIRCMQGRAGLVGGTLEVASSVGGPTRVRLTLPE